MFYLETQNLILKGHSLDNLEKLNKWYNDDEINYFDCDSPEPEAPESINETKKYLEVLIKNNNPDLNRLDYAIHLKKANLFIGTGQIVFIDRYNKRCYLSITIGDKIHWGKGYAKEALQTVIDYCFKKLYMNRIGASIFSFNNRSIRLFKSLGFQHEGTKREFIWKNNKFENENDYSLLKNEWKS